MMAWNYIGGGGQEKRKWEKTATDGYNESLCAACIKKMPHWEPFIPRNWFSLTTKEAFTGKFYWVYSDFLCEDVKWPCLCGACAFLFKSALFCSVPHTIFLIRPTILLPCESLGKILDPFSRNYDFWSLECCMDHQGLCCLNCSWGEELVWDCRWSWPALVSFLLQGTWTHSLVALS